MMNRILSLSIGVFLFMASSVIAADENQDKDKVRAKLAEMFPATSTAEIADTSAKGVYRLEVQGSYAFAYVDGDFVLIGDLYNTKTRENMGELAQAKFLKSEIGKYEDKMISFGPDDAEHKITVFTDVTCYYCKKLHSEVGDLVKAGIQVQYLIWPRQGLGSEGFNKNQSVWCNADQQQAMTDAKADKAVASAACDNPIAETFSFGRQIGVSGTPMIVFEDGSRQPGYLPSPQLIARIKSSSADGE